MIEQSIKHRATNESRHTFLLTVVLLCGIIAGQVMAAFTSEGSYTAVHSCLQDFQNLTETRSLHDISVILQTAFLYLRGAIAVFFFGYCSIGVPLVLLISAIEAFLLSFSTAVFANSAGFTLTAALFGIRCLFLFPAMVYLGVVAMQTAFGVCKGSLPLIRRTGAVFFWLMLGTVLELILVPFFLKTLLLP